MIAILKTSFSKILLGVFIFTLLLYQFLPFLVFVFTKLALLTFIFFIIYPLFTAMEESLHIGICIQQGKFNSIDNLVITYITAKKKHLLLVMSVAVKFRGNFELSERIQIHGGAPLLILLSLCVMLPLIVAITKFPIKDLLWYWIILAIFPIGSLLPFKFISESDGYCIIKEAKHLRLSTTKLIGELLSGIFYGIRYLFLGMYLARKSDNSIISAGSRNIFEYIQKGKFENALSILEEELKTNHNDPELYNNTAWCYCELGTKINRAITLVQKAIELNPDEATYYDTLSWCYFKKGDINKAKHFLSKAISIEPYNSIFQSHLRKIVKKSSNLLLDKE